MSDRYILDGKKAIPCDSLLEWGRWLQNANRHVADETIGDVRISTVFLGLNHGWGDELPQLFETIIFGGPHDGYQDRCSTWEEAEAMHAKAVALVKSSQ